MPHPAPSLAAREENLLVARRLLALSLVLFVLGFVAMWGDLWISYAFLTKAEGPIWKASREGIQKIVDPAETFANGWAIALLLLTFYAVDVARRRGLLRIAVIIFAAGLLANLGKLLIGRWRPKAFFDASADAFTGGVLDSFHGLLPWASLGYRGQSVPSGHAATAVALGIVLCRRWPYASWAFITFVGMAFIQRLAYGHHYPSDCLWGAALACMVAAVCYHPHWAGRYFDRFESRSNASTRRAAPPELAPHPACPPTATVVTEP